MPTETKVPINITIYDRKFPMRVEPANEQLVREAGKMVEQRVVAYRERFTDTDAQGVLSMVALENAVKILEFQSTQSESPLASVISELISLIDAELSE